MRFPRLSRWLGPALIPGLIGALGLFSAAFAGADDDAVMVGEGGSLGQILTDAKGMTLYTWDRDTEPNVTTCYDACAVRWPPHIVTGAPTAPAGVTGTFGATMRTDGTMMSTYNGKPLYYYQTDKAAGDTTGQAVGGTWWIIDADMMMMGGM